MSVLGWIVIGIFAFDIVFFGSMAIIYAIEERRKRK